LYLKSYLSVVYISTRKIQSVGSGIGVINMNRHQEHHLLTLYSQRFKVFVHVQPAYS